MGFSGDSDSKESACNAGVLVPSLHRDDPLEKGMATHSSILAWRIPHVEDLSGYSPWGHKESDTTERLTFSLFTELLTFSLFTERPTLTLSRLTMLCLFQVNIEETQP